MANDRIFIKCDYCGGWKMLLKFFPGYLYNTNNGIIEWIEVHANCRPDLFDGCLSAPGFSLHTEAAIGGDLDPEKNGFIGRGLGCDNEK